MDAERREAVNAGGEVKRSPRSGKELSGLRQTRDHCDNFITGRFLDSP